jgi:hypothetical protein
MRPPLFSDEDKIELKSPSKSQAPPKEFPEKSDKTKKANVSEQCEEHKCRTASKDDYEAPNTPNKRSQNYPDEWVLRSTPTFQARKSPL